MSCVSISQFHSGIVGTNIDKFYMQICDCNILSSVFMKQHSRYCIKIWRRDDYKSILKHMEFNIQKIFIVFWMEEFQEMIHFIIINWFNRSGVWIWNWFIVRLNWKIWSVDLTSPISMAWLLSFPVMAEITGLVLEVEVLYLKWDARCYLFYSFGGYFVSSPWSALNLFNFLLRLGRRNFVPWVVHASALCPILPQHSQILFCIIRRAAITGCRVASSLFLEDEGLKLLEHWPEVVNGVGAPIISI